MMDRFAELQTAAGDVSRETFDSLVDLERELIKWNSQINLVSATTIDDAWRRHILDSAQLFPLHGRKERWVDLGSGGGFPGLVMAAMRTPIQDALTTLVESNRKKAGFLSHFVGKADLRCRIESMRIEDHVSKNAPPDVVSARALASLSDLLGWTSAWIDEGTVALFHKGRDYSAELGQTTALQRYDLIEHPSAIDPESVILEIKRKKRGS